MFPFWYDYGENTQYCWARLTKCKTSGTEFMIVPSSRNSLVLATYLVSVIRDCKQRESWRQGHQNCNRKLILSLFNAPTRQICTAGVKTKAFRFAGWDWSFPFICETSNFRLLFMTSGTSALVSLQLTIIDCEQSLLSQSRQGSVGLERAKLPKGELERERPRPSFHSAGLFFFRSHRSISSLAQPPWGTARSLMWLKRSKSTSSSMITFPKSFLFSANLSSFLVKDK